MNHRFYSKSKKEQTRTLLIIAILAIAFIISSILVSIYTGIYLIGILTFPITLSIVAPFFDMPSLKKSGKMIYYSLLFIGEKPNNGTIQVHGGTLFDYYFVIDQSMNGRQRTAFIIQQYTEGLLALMDEYKNNMGLKVRGTSYIINERTAEKFGFKIVKTDILQKIILFYNYFNILLSNSMAKNKLSFPKLSEIKTYETDISRLLEKKQYIEKLNTSLQKS